MDDANLLTQLCGICHTNTPKYCCPRCSTKTCSLKCVQRHKQWASCSGKRDPAAKVPKSELATPTAFDRDYNFLKGVEKFLGDANHRSKEIHTIQDSASVRSSKVTEFARAHDLRIVRAPKGMNRQLTNRTIYNQNNSCISWTVEIIHADDKCELTHGNEGEPISDIYTNLVRRGPRAAWYPAHKRKREELEGPVSTHTSHVEDRHEPLQASAETSTKRQANVGQDPNVTSSEGGQEISSKAAKAIEPYDMYLVKPFTGGSVKVLIPVDPHASLADCLRKRTILEYPTFQVLPKGIEKFPDNVMLESDYEARQEELIAEVERELGPLERQANELQKRREAELDQSFDDAKLRASIQRDFRTG